MVPDGWLIKTIGEVADVKGGKRLPKGQQLTDENTGYPYIRVTDMIDGGVDVASVKYVPADVAPKISRYRISKEDIFITVAGTLGIVGEIPAELDGANLTENADKLTNIKCNKRFLLEVMRSPIIQKPIDEEKTQNAQPKLALTRIKEFSIPYPPLPEQKKIAQILSTWGKAIATTEQLLANSQRQKKALMQQLLTGKRRLLDKNGVRFSGGWRLAQLSKLFNRVTEKNNGQSTNVVTISGQHGLIRQEDFFKKSVASETLDDYFLLKRGQFAYNKSYSNGYPMGAIKRLNRYTDGVVTTLYICFEITDDKKICGDYWEHYFESGLMNKGLSQVAHEGGRAHGLLNVKPADFFSLKVPLPSFEEQQRIAAVLSESSRRIVSTSQYLDALKREKRALMNKLLTGRLRVKAQ